MFVRAGILESTEYWINSRLCRERTWYDIVNLKAFKDKNSNCQIRILKFSIVTNQEKQLQKFQSLAKKGRSETVQQHFVSTVKRENSPTALTRQDVVRKA